jgi:POT family proton-dependent oligopeptide transporter
MSENPYESPQTAAASDSLPPLPQVAGHPRGLYTLFFTEMWERMSYYGMRALLVLFMVAAVEKGGLGFSKESATAIYGLYTAIVYLVALPGGWIADRLLGAQRCVWYGGILIAAGHFTLIVPGVEAFFLGLALIVAGTGLLKPNISVIVGHLYPEGGGRRDAGFTIFYMGINLGAAMGPLVCSTLGEKVGWHWGFGASGVGMLLGLVQFKLTQSYLGDAGLHPAPRKTTGKSSFDPAWLLVGGAVAISSIVLALALLRVIQFEPVALAQYTSIAIVAIAAVYLAGVLIFGKLSGDEMKRIGVLIVLFIAAAIFWGGFEQAGSSFSLFAKDHTLRTFGGFEVPTGWFQTFNPVFIISLSPVIAGLWVVLTQRGQNPSIPAKCGLALVLMGGGFLVMVVASQLASGGQRVWPTWLIATFLIHTLAELCLSPVGLSAVTKLSPERFVGQMMGLWFLAASLGSVAAGLIASHVASGQAETEAHAAGAGVYLVIACVGIGAGVVLIALSPLMKKWVGQVD